MPLPSRPTTGKPTRTPWAQLIKHAFGADPEKWPKCGGRMVVVAVVRDHNEARRYLEGTGQYAELPGDRKPP
jgi:hypothetical protein